MGTGLDSAQRVADYVTDPGLTDPVLDAIRWEWARFRVGLEPPWDPVAKQP